MTLFFFLKQTNIPHCKLSLWKTKAILTSQEHRSFMSAQHIININRLSAPRVYKIGSTHRTSLSRNKNVQFRKVFFPNKQVCRVCLLPKLQATVVYAGNRSAEGKSLGLISQQQAGCSVAIFSLAFRFITLIFLLRSKTSAEFR